MGLAKRIIPIILHKRGQMVKGRGFASDRVVGHALQAALIHASRSVDELVIIDVTATQENRGPDCDLVKTLASKCFSPLMIGGGIKEDKHIRELLNSGADKVLIGTAANDTDFIYTSSQKYGAQCISVAIDVKDKRVHLRSGKEKTDFDAVEYAQLMVNLGAGELVLTAIDKDGTMSGYDLPLIAEVTESVSVPVVAAGGCSGYPDMYEALKKGASAVGVGALWTFRDATPKGAAQWLNKNGCEVRL